MSDLFDFKAPPNRFAVMGNPVAHSKSPQIHAQFAEALGIAMDYQRIQVDTGGFKQAVSHFAAHDGAGLNITVPYKLEAWDLCQKAPNQLAPRALLAGAVNTLKFESDQSISGDNTDGVGLVSDLTANLGVSLADASILIIGAGGAVRGVLGPILEQGPVRLDIRNRTVSKADSLVEQLRGSAPDTMNTRPLSSGALENTDRAYDLVINGTAASLGGEVPAIPSSCIGAHTVAYDMMYGNEPTPFLRWAEQQGAAILCDGLGMLVEQAAESFQIWHGRRPQTRSVLNALRAELTR